MHAATTTTTTTSTATTETTTTNTAISKTATSVAGTTEAENTEINIRGNIEGKGEQNQKILCVHKLLISSIIFGTDYRIKRKLLGRHEWDIQLTRRQNVPTTTAINTAANTNDNKTLLLLLLFLLLPPLL